MNFQVYVLPVLLILLILYSVIKKQNVYNSFIEGSKGAIPLAVSLFPYITAIFLMCEVFEVSGFSDFFIKTVSPVFTFFGVPKELIKLMIIKPFSGSGSLALLTEVIKNNGVNSYISLCACCLYGSSETTFYVSAVYFSKCKNKKVAKGIVFSLTATFISNILTCLICKLF